MDSGTRRRVGAGGLIAVLAAIATLLVTPARTLEWLGSLSSSPVRFGAALVAVYLLRPLVFWPISAVSLVVGYVYGVQLGVPVGLCGAVFTCLPPYLATRCAGARSGSPLLARLERSGEQVLSVTGHFRGVVAARLAPLPADAVSAGAGFSGVSVGAFTAGTLLGEVPWVTAAVLAGSSMRTLSSPGGHDALSLGLGMAALSALVLAGPIYRHYGDGLGQ
jgi:uncharacterized membrane protein YdjX (TVP38/TMEM64 family)